MRTKTVTIGGAALTLKEYKIKQLKDDIIPKIGSSWAVLKDSDTSKLIDAIGDQMKSIFPELANIDLDNCFPSEIETFLEAWIEVNFSGIRRLLGPVLYFAKLGLPKQESGLENPLASLITGKV
jgi:alpha-L-fucosidase